MVWMFEKDFLKEINCYSILEEPYEQWTCNPVKNECHSVILEYFHPDKDGKNQAQADYIFNHEIIV